MMSNEKFYPQNIIKHCPTCGSGKVSLKEEKMFHCLECGFVWVINPTCAVIAIIKNDKGEILMTIRGNAPGEGELDLPGGFIDIGETAEGCAKREIKEELNLDITNLKFFGTFPNEYLYKGMMYFPLDIVFECKVKDFDTLQANDDVSGYRFINPQDIDLDNSTSKSFPAVIKEYIRIQQYFTT